MSDDDRIKIASATPANANQERLIPKGTPEHRSRCKALGAFVIAVDDYLGATGWMSEIANTPDGQRVVWSHVRRGEGAKPISADDAVVVQREWDRVDL